jgi:hypothetical protein
MKSLTDIPPERKELVEALRAAVAVLSSDFSGTEGSGREALTKCRKALDRIVTSSQAGETLEVAGSHRALRAQVNAHLISPVEADDGTDRLP